MSENKGPRRVSLEGSRQWMDLETGEVREVNQVSVEHTDINFSKIWLANILSAVNEFSSASMDILFWLVKRTEKTRGTNVIALTIREIAQETNRSTHSVNKVLKVLEKHDVIRRKTGHIFVNPDVVYKGTHGGRMDVLLTYKEIENPPLEDTDKQARIERLTRQLQRMSKNYKAVELELERELDDLERGAAE